jgi:hypothetical protein
MMAMSDALRKKLEQRMDRRSFLRGSGLAAAAFATTAAFPLSARAQGPQKPEEKPKDQAEANGDAKEDKETKKDGENAEEDPFKVTKKDADGRDYRICPQCGYNMYKQDRTWTCENCGYSYVE